MTSAEQCVVCPEGTSCSVGSALATPCAPGTFNDQTEQETCTKCEPGKFSDLEGLTACKDCKFGYYCGLGAATSLPCPGGTAPPAGFSSMMTSVTQCVPCPAGTSCAVGSEAPSPCLPGSFGAAERQETCNLCKPGTFTDDASKTACDACTAGYLCVEGASAPQPCRGGTHANQTVLSRMGFLSSLDQCIVCPAGTSCSVGSAEPFRAYIRARTITKTKDHR